MGLLRKLTVVGVPIAGYLIVDQQLSQIYPNIPVEKLPLNTSIKKYLKPNENKYIAYCDTFKKTVETDSIDKLNEQFLSYRALQSLVKENADADDNSTWQSQTITQSTGWRGKYRDTLLWWQWNNKKNVVSNFEKLASWGYPWRMMNGGYHELYIEPTDKDKTFDVYFTCAHEYNDLKDGKVIPEWVQNLHRFYGRIILHLATK